MQTNNWIYQVFVVQEHDEPVVKGQSLIGRSTGLMDAAKNGSAADHYKARPPTSEKLATEHLPSVEVHVSRALPTIKESQCKVHHLHVQCPCVIAAWYGAHELWLWNAALESVVRFSRIQKCQNIV